MLLHPATCDQRASGLNEPNDQLLARQLFIELATRMLSRKLAHI